MQLLKRSSSICAACRHRLRLRLRLFSSSSHARNSAAPKASIDIKHIRRFPALHGQNAIDRNYASQKDSPARINEAFDQWKKLQEETRGLREKNNALRESLAARSASAETADLKHQEGRDTMRGEARRMKLEISATESKEEGLMTEIAHLAKRLPNLTSEETPIGSEPRVVGYINERPASNIDRLWRSHAEIGEMLQLIDLPAAGTVTGFGWYFLLNEAALMEQALVQYALSVAIRRAWRIVSPPSMVYGHMMDACGFMPRDQNGEQQTFSIHQSPEDSKPARNLSATAEIPLAAMKAKLVLDEEDLPLKTVGVSRCYRAEAGARGAQTKGLYRVHEFTKVEMFAWTPPDIAGFKDQAATTATARATRPSMTQQTFDEMVTMQSEILESLRLPCRILEMPSHDLGASAFRKRDIEAYFPSRAAAGLDGGWGEVTSASICTDYQTRRLDTRMRPGTSTSRATGASSASTTDPVTGSTASRGKLAFPFTVNGTAVAIPRVIAAILENGWDEDRREVRVPEVLWPWMAGCRAIRMRGRGGNVN